MMGKRDRDFLIFYGCWLLGCAALFGPLAYAAATTDRIPVAAVTIQCASLRAAVSPELIAQAEREALWLARQLPGPPVPALPQVFEGFRRLLDACGIRN